MLGFTKADYERPYEQFKDDKPGVADLLNWANPVGDGVILCKDGSLLAGWFYRGPDLHSSLDGARNHLTDQMNAAMARFAGGWSIWIDAVRLPSPGYPDPNRSYFPDPISRLVDDERRGQFQAEGAHYESEYAVVVQYTPPLRVSGRIVDLAYDSDGSESHASAAVILQGFERALDSFEDSIPSDLRIQRMRSFTIRDMLGRERHYSQLVNYLHFCLTWESVQIELPAAGCYLDTVIGGKEFWPGETPRIGAVYVACVALQGFPALSHPNILDALDSLAMPMRWSSRFIYMDQMEGEKQAKSIERKWKQKRRGFLTQILKPGGENGGGPVNEDAVTMAAEAGLAVQAISSGLCASGYYTPVVVVAGETPALALARAREVKQIMIGKGFAAEVESVNATEAWLGTLPGHTEPNVRRPPFTTDCIADLLPLAAVWTGSDTHPAPRDYYPPGSPPLAMTATSGTTPFRLNLHVGDVGHTLIFGPTGNGKSTLLAFTAMQALRYPRATVWAFDKGRSMMTATKACRGRHYDIGEAGSPAYCPLSVLETASDIAWAEDWIETCFHLQTGRSVGPGERSAIYRALTLMRAGPHRSLSHFMATVQHVDVREAIKPYTMLGSLGHILDAEEDGIDIGGHFVTFEIGDLMGMGEKSLVPVLLYQFRRFERALRGQPAYLLLDEAWIMLGHSVFREKIREWLKELRKKNCSVVPATQSLTDAVRSGILDVLIESTPTKIFLPNEEADNPTNAAIYRDSFGLNDVQIDIITKATKKRHYYVHSSEGNRLIDLGLGPIALAFTAVSSNDDLTRVLALEAEHGDQWPYLWLAERGVRVPT